MGLPWVKWFIISFDLIQGAIHSLIKLFIILFFLTVFYNHVKKSYWVWGSFLIISQLQLQPLRHKIKKFFFLEPTLTVLTLWLLLVILITTFNESSLSSNGLTFLILSLSLVILIFFFLNNLLYFYIFFELSIIPIFLVILIWGYQRERLFARLRLLLYTFIASLPLLFTLLFLRNEISRTTLSYMLKNLISYNQNSTWVSLTLIRAFLVKTPIYLTHMWLPKAHVEAPVFGSMILAAILLKMGTFGFALFRVSSFNNLLVYIILSLSIWGITTVSILCIKTIDMKILVAYSSVSHIAFLIALVLLNNQLSLIRRVLIILTHGFTSSALFFSVNLIYETSNSRSTILNKGIMFRSTYFFIWAAILMSNIRAPPRINFIAEVLGVFSLINLSMLTFILISLFIVRTSMYTYSIFRITSQLKSNKFHLINLYKKNYLVLVRHLFPIFIFTFNIGIFS